MNQVVKSLLVCAMIPAPGTNLWALDEGTNIIGSKEAPNVLNVVPWQNRELAVDPWTATPNLDSQLLDDSLKPVDRDELRREIEYFDQLRHSDPGAGGE